MGDLIFKLIIIYIIWNIISFVFAVIASIFATPYSNYDSYSDDDDF